MPPIAPKIGNDALFKSESSPYIFLFQARVLLKGKILPLSRHLIQCDILLPASLICQKCVYESPNEEFAKTKDVIVAEVKQHPPAFSLSKILE
jgi:hypothetical protein